MSSEEDYWPKAGRPDREDPLASFREIAETEESLKNPSIVMNSGEYQVFLLPGQYASGH